MHRRRTSRDALCRQQFAGFGFVFVATATGAGAVGVDFLRLAGHGHNYASEFLHQFAPDFAANSKPLEDRFRGLGR